MVDASKMESNKETLSSVLCFISLKGAVASGREREDESEGMMYEENDKTGQINRLTTMDEKVVGTLY